MNSKQLLAQYDSIYTWFKNALARFTDEDINQRLNKEMNHVKYITGWTPAEHAVCFCHDRRGSCGKKMGYPFYHKLKNATTKQREKYATSEFGIHWEDLDEDLSFIGFF